MARSFGILLGVLFVLSSPVSCLTAWWTELSPHLAMQDPATGDILYTACNSNSTPILPTDGLNIFLLQRKPRLGTSIAAAGWYDVPKKTTIASIFYQAEDNSIVNGYFTCNFDTGHYAIKGEYVISTTAGLESIHNQTGLAVELLGAENGYRVFFHDEAKTVNVLSYTTRTDWQLKGAISQDPVGGMALTSVHSGQLNMSVVFPKDSENVEISRFFKDETWHLATLPRPLLGDANETTKAADILLDSTLTPNFTMPAFANNLTSLGATVDKAYIRSIFYLGTDAKLHQMSNIDWQWKLMPDQDARLWPAADVASGSFATTSNFDTSEAWIWYQSNGSLVQLYHGEDGLWKQAAVVPSFNATKAVEEEPQGTATPSASSTATAKPVVLSTGAKAGIGIGVSFGVVALAGGVILLLVRRRRQRAAEAAEAARLKEAEAVAQMGPYGDGGVGPYMEFGNLTWGLETPTEKHGTEILEADAVGTTAPQELANGGERYELVGEGHWREMDATGQNKARRSIGGWREAQQAPTEK
ncbi:hypothetical protein BDP81DRAFT_388838 [Colletotrichum phormii]|uniref:Uncharacterized protein n=1 Tax=Colletotrichum phormii TaxID=359342 RepID=A0AAJ0ELW5_9PEZI|nr:uncharacterized protein BDP81DRAFT_388838 [Colletotrichum phormii]KAK1655982.1 hypothetical protein BDP81DRAFT_388838 [Colletotrichum phormii]